MYKVLIPHPWGGGEVYQILWGKNFKWGGGEGNLRAFGKKVKKRAGGSTIICSIILKLQGRLSKGKRGRGLKF